MQTNDLCLIEIELFDHLIVCKQMTDGIVNDKLQYLEQFKCMLMNE